MKIEQQPKFQPITITLETKEDAEMFWTAVRYLSSINSHSQTMRDMWNKISDWFSTQAQL